MAQRMKVKQPIWNFSTPPAKMSLSRIYNKIKPVGIKANDRKNKQINNRRCKL